jgi:hypothetical protein
MNKEGDVVLVHMDGNPAFFARIEAITADVKRDWYQVKMLVLQVPLLVITWILREAYINGEEFTMGGRPVKLAKVVAPEEEETSAAPPHEEAITARETSEISSTPPEKGKVLSFADRRKKDHSS